MQAACKHAKLHTIERSVPEMGGALGHTFRLDALITDVQSLMP